MTCAIHQPNFCPWGTYFNKIKESDIFIIMNWATFPKNNFVNRFMHKGKWYTMRVNQSHEPIINKEYLYPVEDWNRITSQLPKLKVFDDCVNSTLSIMNESIIKKACEMFGIKTWMSTDLETDLRGTDRLIEICKYWEADTYLSGISGRNYLEMDKFEKAGIKVIFQDSPDKRALVELI